MKQYILTEDELLSLLESQLTLVKINIMVEDNQLRKKYINEIFYKDNEIDMIFLKEMLRRYKALD